MNTLLSCLDRLRSSELRKLPGTKGLLQLEAVMRLLDRRDLYGAEDEYGAVKSCFSPYASFAEYIHSARQQNPAPKPRDAVLAPVLKIGYASAHYLPESLTGRKRASRAHFSYRKDSSGYFTLPLSAEEEREELGRALLPPGFLAYLDTDGD